MVREITSRILHKHYCENNVEAIVSTFSDTFSWIGAAEHEYAVGGDRVRGIFRQFAGKVPKCNISDEHYDVLELAEDIYLCSGMFYVATDPGTGIFLRVHQRITILFRWEGESPRCCHIHISNPYSDMVSGDVGFPTRMARQSYEYLMRCVREQQELLDAQTAELSSIYETIPCAIFPTFPSEV